MANLNLNKVILGGRIAQDLELKQTPQGVAVTTFSIAVNRRGKEAQTDFINCQAWRQTAETVCKYFKKGSSICISGQIQVRSWQDQQGNKRYATEVVADEVYFVDSKADGQASIPTEPAFQQAPKFEEIAEDEDLPF
jgi:single-strand DNA-binding protein